MNLSFIIRNSLIRSFILGGMQICLFLKSQTKWLLQMMLMMMMMMTRQIVSPTIPSLNDLT